MQWVLFAVIVLAAVVSFNLCAAGVAAVLHAWRSKMRRGGRTVLASAVAGFLPASSIMAIGILGSPENITQDAAVYAAIFGICFAVATLVSLPGAIIVARKLEAPGNDHRAFE